MSKNILAIVIGFVMVFFYASHGFGGCVGSEASCSCKCTCTGDVEPPLGNVNFSTVKTGYCCKPGGGWENVAKLCYSTYGDTCRTICKEKCAGYTPTFWGMTVRDKYGTYLGGVEEHSIGIDFRGASSACATQGDHW